MTKDDLLYRFRLRILAMAGELGNVRGLPGDGYTPLPTTAGSGSRIRMGRRSCGPVTRLV